MEDQDSTRMKNFLLNESASSK
jgi:hypothetical protein